MFSHFSCYNFFFSAFLDFGVGLSPGGFCHIASNALHEKSNTNFWNSYETYPRLGLVAFASIFCLDVPDNFMSVTLQETL